MSTNGKRTSSTGDVGHDVLVVGGGVIGLACAWRIAQRGASVCVLERSEPGSGASRVAAGMLAPVGEVSWGEERLLRANLASAELWPDFADQLAAASGREVGYRRCGALHVALDRDEAEELRRRHDLQTSLGLETEWLRPSGCRELEAGLATSVSGGVHAPHDAEADPRMVVAALVDAFEALGGDLVCGREVVELLVDGDRAVGVRTDAGGEHRAEHVVVASGAWSGNAGWLEPELRPPVRPVKGQLVVLRGPASEPVCERVVVSPWVYCVPRIDGRLVVGATVEERGFDTTVTAGGVHELLRESYRVLPEVAELELVETIAGLRPGTPDNTPLVGEAGAEGLVLATGHYRNGILLAPLTAEAVACVVAGETLSGAAAGLEPGRFDHAEAVA